MTTPTSRENSTRALSTADLAAASRQSQRVNPDPQEMDETELEQDTLDRDEPELQREEVMASHRGSANSDLQQGRAERAAAARGMGDSSPGVQTREPDGESLEPLFAADQAEGYRNRWLAIQSSFVDDPRAAVRAGDELVAQVMSELANSFAAQRHRFESQLGDSGTGNTEDLRVALRSYRSFFDRLLSL